MQTVYTFSGGGGSTGGGSTGGGSTGGGVTGGGVTGGVTGGTSGAPGIQPRSRAATTATVINGIKIFFILPSFLLVPYNIFSQRFFFSQKRPLKFCFAKISHNIYQLSPPSLLDFSAFSKPFL
jgi:hypothetical protein